MPTRAKVFHAGLFLWLLGILLARPAFADHYQHFKVSIYCRAYEVREMKDPTWLSNAWASIGPQLAVDKVYLEMFRDGVVPDQAAIDSARRFFAERGVRVAAGIATVANERNLFQSLCYSTPADRDRLKQVVEYAAGQFDEMILDDFFFSNCKCERCIAARGDRSWTQFKLDQMDEVARDLVVAPAKAVNPKIKVVLKFPNWYEHYQGLGYNLAAGAKYFDGIYTGTETRQPFNNDQHLPQYLGYLIFRYLENVAPNRNGGGWVDTGGMIYADRYAEQLWLTLFAKAPEITLFDWRQAQHRLAASERGAWQDSHPSYDFDAVMQRAGGVGPATIAGAAGFVFEQVDAFLGALGKPVGVAAYKPLNSVGEDYLHDYLGMVGIPMELTPDFPTAAHTVFLAESAAADPALVDKIKKQLVDGKNVVITSGLLRALRGKGIEGIAEIRCTDRRVTFKDYLRGYAATMPGDAEMTIPVLEYITNDAWALVSASASGIPYPLLLRAKYANGFLYVLTLPDNFGDIYKMPAAVLNQIRNGVAGDLFVRLEAPAQVSLFAYDNGTFIVESFRDEPVSVKVAVLGKDLKLRDLQSNEEISGAEEALRGWGRGGGENRRMTFAVELKAHSYRVFRVGATDPAVEKSGN